MYESKRDRDKPLKPFFSETILKNEKLIARRISCFIHAVHLAMRFLCYITVSE